MIVAQVLRRLLTNKKGRFFLVGVVGRFSMIWQTNRSDELAKKNLRFCLDYSDVKVGGASVVLRMRKDLLNFEVRPEQFFFLHAQVDISNMNDPPKNSSSCRLRNV